MAEPAGPPRHLVGLLGGGILRDAIATSLAPSDGGVPRTLSRDRLASVAGCGMAVVVSDAWDTTDHEAVRTACGMSAVPWLPVWTELGKVVIGPVELPGQPGCVTCASVRRTRLLANGYAAVIRTHRDRLRSRPSAWLTPSAVDTVAALVAEEVRRLDRGEAPLLRGAVVTVDLRHLSVTRHQLLPDPMCPHCGDPPADSAELAVLQLDPRPKPAPDRYRSRDLTGVVDLLAYTYVDGRLGLLGSVIRESWSDGPALSSVPVGLPTGEQGYGHGRGSGRRDGHATAMLEALERYAGILPAGKRTSVEASYLELSGEAVDPRSLGLHSTRDYQRPGYHCQPFDPERRYRWVWGYSFAGDRPILVPEQVAYYGAHGHGPDTAPFAYETSNGCALGASLAEAILYGLLEVAERDAFLMTWYARLPVPRIELPAGTDPAISLLAASIENDTGLEVQLFDATLEQRLPCIWAMAVHPRDGGWPRAVCAAGAHLHPEHAALGALKELGFVAADAASSYQDYREPAGEMVADPELVREMPHHQQVYTHPGAFPRLAFLAAGGRVRRLDQVGERPPAHTDLRDDAFEAVRRFLDTGLDVIVVDQTTPEHRLCDLSCVKVIIPGTLPMTFGHAQRRIEGLPRLWSVPQLLGYHDRPLTRAELNPHPHPFP